MGMLFNTDATLKLLEITNNAFNSYSFSFMKTSSYWLNTFASTGSFNTYAHVAQRLSMDHAEPGKSKKWQNWLKLFDQSPAAAKVYPWIHGAMTDTSATCRQVEFFAVPSASATIDATSQKVPDKETQLPGGNNPYTLCITIATQTADQLGC
jgi:hypothetical protein